MTKLRLGILALAGLVATGLVVSPSVRSWASGFFTNGVGVAGGTQYPTTLPLTGAEQLPADTELSSGQSPQSEAITTGQLSSALSDPGNPRNFLLNGDMAINQQGSATITGGTTTITALQFSADRWFVDTNVTSGAGRSVVKTATPAPPTGFTQEINAFRNSGALTQPVCLIQEIETTRSTQLAGQYVVLSAYLYQAAGLTAPANVVSGYVIYGTGTDQGIATLTASPAITPAWTGIGATSAAGASTTQA